MKANAEKLLTCLWGKKVELTKTEVLNSSQRSTVTRYEVSTKHLSAPTHIIAKQNSSFPRAAREGSSLVFLQSIFAGLSPAPNVYAWDSRNGLLLMQNLVSSTTLCNILQTKNYAVASSSLVSLARVIGKTQARSMGHQDKFIKICRKTGASSNEPDPKAEVNHAKGNLIQFTNDLGIKIRMNIDSDLNVLERFLSPNGPFMAFSHNDICPDNYVVTEPYDQLIDFEFSRYQHALLDGVFGRLCFPSCWCAGRIPGAIIEKMESGYRDELIQGCVMAQDDNEFNRAIVESCVWRYLRLLDSRTLTQDLTWGTVSHQQRSLLGLEKLLEAVVKFEHRENPGATLFQIEREQVKRTLA